MTISEGKTICFTFKRFALETSTPFCSYDYMKFGDIKYCGRGLWQYGIVTTRTESTVWFENFCCECFVFQSHLRGKASGCVWFSFFMF